MEELPRNARIMSQLEHNLKELPTVLIEVIHDFATEEKQIFVRDPIEEEVFFCDSCCSCRLGSWICSFGRCGCYLLRCFFSCTQFIGCYSIMLCTCHLPLTCMRCCILWACPEQRFFNRRNQGFVLNHNDSDPSFAQCTICGVDSLCLADAWNSCLDAHMDQCDLYRTVNNWCCDVEVNCCVNPWVSKPFQTEFRPTRQLML